MNYETLKKGDKVIFEHRFSKNIRGGKGKVVKVLPGNYCYKVSREDGSMAVEINPIYWKFKKA